MSLTVDLAELTKAIELLQPRVAHQLQAAHFCAGERLSNPCSQLGTSRTGDGAKALPSDCRCVEYSIVMSHTCRFWNPVPSVESPTKRSTNSPASTHFSLVGQPSRTQTFDEVDISQRGEVGDGGVAAQIVRVQSRARRCERSRVRPAAERMCSLRKRTRTLTRTTRDRQAWRCRRGCSRP